MPDLNFVNNILYTVRLINEDHNIKYKLRAMSDIVDNSLVLSENRIEDAIISRCNGQIVPS